MPFGLGDGLALNLRPARFSYSFWLQEKGFTALNKRNKNLLTLLSILFIATLNRVEKLLETLSPAELKENKD
jgi:hypothetical protein